MDRGFTRLLLLPGMDGTGSLFQPLLEELGPETHAEVVCYPVDEHIDYDGIEERVRARFVGAGATVVLAESFSGHVAVRLAADPPPGLRGVVLAATFVTPPAPSALAALVRPLLFSRPPPAIVFRSLFVGWDAPNALVEAVRGAIACVQPDVLAYRLRTILAEDGHARIRSARVPIELIRPSRDRLVWSYRPLVEAASGLRCSVVDGPHLILQRRPEECARIVRAFVERLG